MAKCDKDATPIDVCMSSACHSYCYCCACAALKKPAQEKKRDPARLRSHSSAVNFPSLLLSKSSPSRSHSRACTVRQSRSRSSRPVGVLVSAAHPFPLVQHSQLLALADHCCHDGKATSIYGYTLDFAPFLCNYLFVCRLIAKMFPLLFSFFLFYLAKRMKTTKFI